MEILKSFQDQMLRFIDKVRIFLIDKVFVIFIDLRACEHVREKICKIKLKFLVAIHESLLMTFLLGHFHLNFRRIRILMTRFRQYILGEIFIHIISSKVSLKNPPIFLLQSRLNPFQSHHFDQRTQVQFRWGT